MAGKSAVLTVKILSDASQAGKGIDSASGKFSKFESGMSKMTPYAAAAAGGLALFGKQAVDSASQTEQSMGAIESVFGKNAGTVKGWAEGAATSVGLAESEYGNLASTMGASLQAMGFSSDQAAKKTNDMIGLGADLAATFGGTTSDAVGALSSALRGEMDPLEQYGIKLSQAQINSRLAEKGMDGLTGKALDQAKAAIIMEEATSQAGGAVGAFAREQDTAAGSAQVTAAQWENAKAALGESLLPAVTAVTTALGGMAGWMQENASLVTVVAGVIGGLAASILAVNGALKVYRATMTAVNAVMKVTKAMALGTRIQLAALAVQQKVTAAATKVAAVAQRVFNAAMRMNPIGIVITAIMALVGVFVLLWKRNAAFRNFFINSWKKIKAVASVVWKGIKVAVSVVIKAITIYIKVYVAVVKAIWKAIKTVAVASWNGIKKVVKAVSDWMKRTMKAVGTVIKGIWKAIKSAASTAWDGIKSAVKKVAEWMKSALKVVGTVIKGVWTGIKSAASSAWDGVKGAVKTVRDWMKTAFNGVKTAISNVWSGIKSAFDTAFNPIKGVIDGIKSAFDRVADAARSVVDWFGRIKMPSISWPKPPAWVDKLFSAPLPPEPAPAIARGGGRPVLFAGGVGGPPAGPIATALTGGSVQININGGLSSSSDIARAVRRVVRTDNRRRGGVVIDRRRQQVGI